MASDRLGTPASPVDLRLPRLRTAQLIAAAGLLAAAPLIGYLVANFDLRTGLLFAAGSALFLIVLWSVEATFYVLIFSMLLSPEFIAGGLSGQSTLQRGVTLRFDDYVIVMIGLAWLVRLAVYKEVGVFRRNPLTTPIFLYLAACALATSVGVLAERVVPVTGFFFVMKYFEYTVVYFMVVNYVSDRAQVKRLLYAALVTAVIIAVVAMLQIPGGGRPTAPFEGEEGEPNTLGGYLVLMLAVVLGFLSESKTVSQRLSWGGLAALLVVPLLFTLSRTSWIALGAMLLTVIVLSRQKPLFLFLAAAAAVYMIVSPPAPVLERVQYTVAGRPARQDTVELFGFAIEPSAAARLTAWTDMIENAPDQPLFGHGVTGYHFLDAQYPRTVLETGLVGLAAFAWLLWSLFKVGAELLRNADDRLSRALGIGFMAGFMGMLAHGIGANTFIIVRIMEPFWLLAGLTVVLTLVRQRQAGGGGRRPPGGPLPSAAGC